MNNTEMQEFLEKELPEIKESMLELTRPYHEDLLLECIVKALDKAVEDVRKLRGIINEKVEECPECDRWQIHSKSCSIRIALEQTSWAEVKKK